MNERATAEDDLIEWAQIYRDRDRRVRVALAAGITKHQIHQLTGISRPTIDKLLKEPTMITTEYGSWGNYDNHSAIEDSVTDYLADFADDYDVKGLTDAFRDAINEQLSDIQVSLRGSEFYGLYPRRDDAVGRIKAAIETVDLGDLAQQYDRSVD